MKSNRCNTVSSTVDGKSGAYDIAELFASKYKDLYFSVSYDMNKMLSSRQEIDNVISLVGYANEDVITCSEILEAVHNLKHNKCDGFSGIISDHVINACDLEIRVGMIKELVKVRW